MPLLDFIKSSPNQAPDPSTQWTTLLLEAKEELWKQNIDRANVLYSKVSKEAEIVKPKSLDDEIFAIRAEAKLGIWAIQYFRDPGCRANFREILEGHEARAKFWLFVARVFGLKQDTSTDALFVYKNLLKRKPSEGNARTVISLMNTVSFSEDAYDLLKVAAELLPQDLEVAARCCRWAIIAKNTDEAARRARRILEVEPDHIEANRCLGYISEVHGDWKQAAYFYEFSKDWLRQAVCLNHAGDFQQALNSLKKASPSEKKSHPWMYHVGWASFQTGDFTTGTTYWREIKRLYPQKCKTIDEQLVLLQKRAHYHILEKADYRSKTDVSEEIPEEYKNELQMREGAFQLFINRTPQLAEAKFRPLAVQSPKNFLPSTYLLTAIASQKADLSIDKTFSEQLQKFYGNASLYIFFRGLWLAFQRPEVARLYIEKAVQLNVIQYLPLEAVSGLQWLLGYWTGNNNQFLYTYLLNSNHVLKYQSFLQAITSSILLYQIKSQIYQDFEWLNNIEPVNPVIPGQPEIVRMVYYASSEQWSKTIPLARHMEDSTLEQELISFGLSSSINQKNFIQAAEIVSHGQSRFPDNALYQEIAAKLKGIIQITAWRNRDYQKVVSQMEGELRSDPGNTSVHHTLALLHTRWAVEQDKVLANEPIKYTIDLWKYAIGHWAVALSDKKYWKQWKKDRGQAYEGLEELNIDNLVMEQIPELLKAYFNERENHSKAAEADRFHSYSVLLEQEIDVVATVQHLIAKASKAGENLPEVFLIWISPTLIKEHGGEQLAKDFIPQLSKFNLSRQDERLLKLAFSHLGDVVHLAASGKYTQALSRIENIERDPKFTKAERKETEEEHITILENYVQSLIKSLRWSDAVKRSHEGMRIQTENKTFEALFVEANIGLANSRLQEDDHDLAKIATDLKEVKKVIKQPGPELNALLAEVLVKWGFEALKKEQTTKAEERFEEALRLSSSNLQAREGMAWVYFDKAVNASEKDNFKLAYEHAKTMYEYSQTPTMANFYARVVGRYAIYLADQKRYKQAIDLILSTEDVPYDPSEVDLSGLLAAILTDHGAVLLNSGQVSAGIEATRMALQLDPTNQIARDNLRIATRGRY